MLLHSIAANGTHVFSLNSSSHLLVTADSFEKTLVLPDAYQKLPKTPVSCFLGTIKLKYNKYVVVGTSHTVTGTVLQHEVAKIDAFKVIPLLAITDMEEKHYVQLLYQHLEAATLFFSLNNAFDLTRSVQDQYTTPNQAPNHKFWWNHYLSEEAVAAGAAEFVAVAIYGYAKSSRITAPDHRSFDFLLITRRAISRAGTRYFRRGIDDQGEVANFNETEQILIAKDNSNNENILLVVQIRGSVPIYWAEINNLKYKPNLALSQRSSLSATERHFDDIVKQYGPNGVYCVNLVNQSGYEKPVKQGFELAIEALPEKLALAVHYIYFDFHHECSKMRWDRVDLLLQKLAALLYTSDQYFQYNLSTKTVVQIQDKVVRTNCMDCLDRTNVVQLTLGRWVLQNQLTKLGFLQSHEVTPWQVVIPNLLPVFQNYWADNADLVSFSYSGTGALKTDYTRTGKRTKQGALNDLLNSITRYYKNNYTDGSRQDGYDLVLGQYRPFQDSVRNPFVDNRPPDVQLWPYLVGTSFLVFFAVLFFPRGPITNWKNIIVMTLSLLYSLRGLFYIHKNGYQFVNWPKLEKLDFLKKLDKFYGGKLNGIFYEESDQYKVVGKKST